MADAVTVTLGTWSEAGTTIGAVEAAIAGLRRSEERGAVRTAVLTLVALPSTARETSLVLDTVHESSGRHPAHAIVVITQPDQPAGLDADVHVHAVERGDTAVCFEDLVLTVKGAAAGHLDSVIEPFTISDLPVVVWLPDRLPALGDPVLLLADRLVVDSRVADNVDGPLLRDLAAIAQRVTVTDLSWVRLAPWRELLAGLFEGADFRPFIDGVTHVRVSGKPGPRHLLGGWLLTRLDVPGAAVELVASDHASIEVLAEHEGRRARFAVERPGDAREVYASATVDGGPAHQRVLRLRDRSPARVLSQGLARREPDAVFEAALAGAVLLSS